MKRRGYIIAAKKKKEEENDDEWMKQGLKIIEDSGHGSANNQSDPEPRITVTKLP